uniref:Epiplasmin C n=1 Tax=Tetrahymena pyriformis TaxID=5908 RepID=Q9NDI5_TETPY|nr:epiplasmin C [Tetrahymena pyriformis]
MMSDAENDHVKRSKKNLEDQHNLVIQERDRMILQLKELTVKITEFQSLIASRDVQINTLKVQNEALSIRLVLTTAELERISKERVEAEPLRRKVSDLEGYLVVQEKTIEELRIKLGQQDQVISQLRIFEIRCTQYEQDINALKMKLEEFLRTLQLKSQECDELRGKLSQYDLLVIRYQQLEQKLQESEQNSLLLIKKIEELQALLNDEGVKRSKNRNDLDVSLRDKQALEEKLVMMTQQIEFLTRKCQQQEQDINNYRLRISELEILAGKVAGYEQQIQLLSQQIERLNQLLREKDNQIGQLTVELNNLKLANGQIVQLQEQIAQQNQVIVLRTAEIESLRKRLAELEVLLPQLKMFESRCAEYEQIINALRQRLAELEGQLGDENVKRSQKDGELAISLRDKQALEEKLVMMTQQIEFLSQKVNQLTAQLQERDNIIAQLRVYEVRVKEYENVINALRQRVAELEGQLGDENVKRSKKDGELAISLRDKQALEEKLVHLTQQIEFLTQKVAQYERMIQDLQGQLGDENLKRSKKDGELAISLRDKQALEEKLVHMTQQIEFLTQKVSQYERMIQELQGQLGDENVKRSKKDGELAISLRDKQALEEKLVHMTQQIEFLSVKVTQYEKLIGELQAQLQDRDSPYRLVDIRIKEYENIINALKQRNAELENNLGDESTKRSKRDGELAISLRDKQALEEKLVHMTQQIEFLTQKVAQYERMIQDLQGQLGDENVKRSKKDGELAISLRDKQALEEKLVHMTQQIEFLTQKVSQYEKLLAEQQAQLQERDNIISQLRVYEIRVKEYENVINALRQRLAELEGQLGDENVKRSKKDGELAISLRDKQALEEKLVMMTQQIEFLDQKVNSWSAQPQERDNIIAQLRVFEIRVKEYGNVINALRQRVAELEAMLGDENVKRSKRDGELAISLRDKQALEEKLVHLTQQIEFLDMKVASYEKQIQEKDALINQLRIEISRLQINLQQLSNADQEVKRLSELLVVKTTEIDQLRKRLAECEFALQEFNLVQAKLQECEKNNSLLRQRIAELEALLNDENIKRSRGQNDLEISLRDRQALEEKLVHLTQQIEFLTRKVTQITEENNNLKIVVASYQQIFDEWQQISVRHGNFSQLLEQVRVRVQQLSISSSSSIITQSTSSYAVRGSNVVPK